ncbi:MAG: esterase/lipase family protein [Planctomycetota bacterium]
MGLLDGIGSSFTNAAQAFEQAAEGAIQKVTEASEAASHVVRDAGRTSGAASQLQALRSNLTRTVASALDRLQANDGGIDSKGRIGWLKRTNPSQKPTRDVTGRFEQLVGAAKTGDRTLPDEAQDHVYLVVPGLFTERYPGYMDGNVARLQELGLDAQKVPVDTDAPVETNAAQIRDAILEASKDGRQVVLMGHSKGGVDIAAALALYPELKPHVRSFVAMQAPYGGSPVAHDATNCPTLKSTVDGFIKGVFKGDPRALSDLSYSKRQQFVRDHPLPEGIPTVSLATSNSSAASLTSAGSAYIQARYGEPSDGLVPRKDAEIPGSSVIRLDDMDHAMGAIQGPGGLCKYDTGDITQALVTLALTTPA